MRIITAILFFVTIAASAQQDDRVVINLDSYPSFVKTVNVKAWKEQPGDTTLYTSGEMKIGSTGKWAVRHEMYADGDESYDTIRYNGETRTKTIRRSNSFESSTTTIVYNPDSTVKSIYFDADMRDDISDEYEYDKKKRLVRHTQIFAETRMVEDYVYDKDSRVSTITRSSGSLTAKKLNLDSRITQTYDAGGRVILRLEQYFGANETLTVSDSIFWTYDARDPKVTKRESREWGKNQTTYTYRYDANGRMISKTCQLRTPEDNGNVFICNYEWKYDDHGYCSYRFTRDGEFMQEWTCETKYNDKGLPVECRYTVDGTAYVYRWEYTYWQ